MTGVAPLPITSFANSSKSSISRRKAPSTGSPASYPSETRNSCDAQLLKRSKPRMSPFVRLSRGSAMVKFVPDNMHGFGERPHYEPRELDSIFEKIVTDFLRKKHGKVEFPIVTDDLTTLIETHVTDLDLYADLTGYGANTEGATVFARSGQPKVLISDLVHKH